GLSAHRLSLLCRTSRDAPLLKLGRGDPALARVRHERRERATEVVGLEAGAPHELRQMGALQAELAVEQVAAVAPRPGGSGPPAGQAEAPCGGPGPGGAGRP